MSDKLSLELVIPESLNPRGVNVRVAGSSERPLFCLADVCAVLDIANPRNVSDRLDPDEKDVRQTDTPGGRQQMTFISEAGLYAVLLRSDKPQAKPFRKWVTGEVLPSIRKHGCYPPPRDVPTPSPLLALRDMVDKMIEHEQELVAIRLQQQAQAEDLEDAKLLATAAMDCHLSNHGYYSILAFFRLKRCDVSLPEASAMGVRATAVCKKRGITVGHVRDPRFGVVNTYPEHILEELWGSRE